MVAHCLGERILGQLLSDEGPERLGVDPLLYQLGEASVLDCSVQFFVRVSWTRSHGFVRKDCMRTSVSVNLHLVDAVFGKPGKDAFGQCPLALFDVGQLQLEGFLLIAKSNERSIGVCVHVFLSVLSGGPGGPFDEVWDGRNANPLVSSYFYLFFLAGALARDYNGCMENKDTPEAENPDPAPTGFASRRVKGLFSREGLPPEPLGLSSDRNLPRNGRGRGRNNPGEGGFSGTALRIVMSARGMSYARLGPLVGVRKSTIGTWGGWPHGVNSRPPGRDKMRSLMLRLRCPRVALQSVAAAQEFAEFLLDEVDISLVDDLDAPLMDS